MNQQVPSVAPITGSSSTQQTIADLQAQMLRYSQAIESLSKQARADYAALQSAITTGDAGEAQAALSRLKRDDWAASSNGPAQVPAAPAHAAHGPSNVPPAPNSLNKIA
jgi:hypothetical protein